MSMVAESAQPQCRGLIERLKTSFFQTADRMRSAGAWPPIKKARHGPGFLMG